MSTLTAVNDAVYYSGHYWNNFETVYREINRRASGDYDTKWYEHFFKLVGKRRFEKALFLNCGNGWVEREMFENGLFKEAIGIDYSERLLQDARRDGKGMPIRYHQADINDAIFFEEGFDLVVNHAACHHIVYLDKVMKKISTLLAEGGFLIGFDYVGPHRNQYPYEHWNECWNLNNELPEALRKEMRYPHLKTMLATDPTEAVHSELIIEVTSRYFDFIEHKHIGGGLAYELLSFNRGLIDADNETREKWLEYILERDLQFTAHVASYFDYYVCSPKKLDLAEYAWFGEEEVARENRAADNGGEYYKKTLLQTLYDIISTRG